MKDGMCSMTFDIVVDEKCTPAMLQLSWNEETEELSDYRGKVVGYAKLMDDGRLIPYGNVPVTKLDLRQ